MPYIKEEELEKLNAEKNIFQKRATKIKRSENTFKIISLLLLIALIICCLFWYKNHTKNKAILKHKEDRQVQLLDSIQSLSVIATEISALKNAEVLYSVQLGVFKHLDLDFNEEQAKNFKELETINGRAYLLGSFLTYKDATQFKNEVKRLGLRDVFLVPYNKNQERIHIKEALVLSNEN